MLKVKTVCGSGMASSVLIKLKIDKVFKSLGIEAELDHCTVEEAREQLDEIDVIFCEEALSGHFTEIEQQGKTVIGLENILSQAEIEAKVQEKIVNR
ncbi:MAG: PTS ascorbate transporter subunit IIB [Epulopiscium sp. Nele67-Bin004]|nr:MAG: PTS ascorbate transporter subunit IIB [Epulopiscium sp. Nele67-Bin004]